MMLDKKSRYPQSHYNSISGNFVAIHEVSGKLFHQVSEKFYLLVALDENSDATLIMYSSIIVAFIFWGS